MKLARPLVAVCAFALVVGSALGLAGAASAATPGVTYVPLSDVAVSPLPVDGVPGWSLYVATGTSGLSGLTATMGGHLRYTFTTPLASATVLEDLAAASAYTSDDPTHVYPEFDYLPTPSSAAQILFPDVPGPTAFSSTAATFQSIFAVGSIPANTSKTLAQFDAAIAAVPGATIAGVEFFDGTPSTYSSANINGTQFIFTPQPAFTAPTSITVADFTAAPGITVTTNGFLPGESVDVVYDTANSGSTIATVTADPNGAITFSHFDPTASPGAYDLRFFGSVPNPQTFAFDVTAAAVTAPALVATGVPMNAPLLFGSLVLLAGLALAGLAMRRRSRAS